MEGMYWGAGIIGFIFLMNYFYRRKNEKEIQISFKVVLFLGIFLRIIVFNIDAGFSNDLNTFKYWCTYLYDNGITGIYERDIFLDYPPLYLYVLYLTGALKSLFHIESQAVFTAMIKIPPIIFDLFLGCFIYYGFREQQTKERAAFYSGLYLLNPAVILISSVWGQVDSVYTFMVVVSIYLLSRKSYRNSWILYVLAVLTKPQALFFAPVYLYSVYLYFEDNRAGEAVKRFFMYVFQCLMVIVIVTVPFTRRLNFIPVFSQYFGTLDSYSYASVNAYNFYTFKGANWVGIQENFLMVPYWIWGAAFIVLISLGAVYILHKNRAPYNYFFAGAFLNIMAFMFSVKMHERYLFPALALLLITYIMGRDRKVLLLYGLFSITFFLNCSDVIYMYKNELGMEAIHLSSVAVSGINLVLAGVLLLYAGDGEAKIRVPKASSSQGIKAIPYGRGETDKKDWLCIGAISLIYGFVAFYNLGDKAAPENMYIMNEGDTVSIALENETLISRVQYYLGPKAAQEFTVEFSSDGNIWELYRVEKGSAFSWEEVPVFSLAKQIKITADTQELLIMEMAFRDSEDNLIEIKGDIALFDEQALVPEYGYYKNSTYFDEIYHSRTAYEMLKGLPVYEWTHPPLGKVIISAGIALFGMNPFGWRVMGALFGVLMLPLIYLFSKRIFSDRFFACFTAVIFAFDFMHYTQTRISTIDTYTVFFTIGMYYFMYRYMCRDFYGEKLSKQFLYLGLSGVFMALNIACKWQGVYSGAGLGILFFIHMYDKYREGKIDRGKLKLFKKNFTSTFGFCLVFFIAVPVFLYFASYFMYFNTPGYDNIRDIIDLQQRMFQYHSSLESTHPYSSDWWSWPLILRPVFYYAHSYSENMKAGISAFGNPAVWWIGIIGFFYTIRDSVKNKRKISLFLLIGYGAQVLPWVMVSRTTYIYHYFPAVPFVVLMITFMMKDLFGKYRKRISLIYAGAVIALFIMFYPVLSGAAVNSGYVTDYLRWMPGWQLIIE